MLYSLPFCVIKKDGQFGRASFGFELLLSIKENVHFQGFKLLLKEHEIATFRPVSIKINNFVKHSDLYFTTLS